MDYGIIDAERDSLLGAARLIETRLAKASERIGLLIDKVEATAAANPEAGAEATLSLASDILAEYETMLGSGRLAKLAMHSTDFARELASERARHADPSA
jgi:hypothetical protein